jgi:hypothetical protein
LVATSQTLATFLEKLGVDVDSASCDKTDHADESGSIFLCTDANRPSGSNAAGGSNQREEVASPHIASET